MPDVNVAPQSVSLKGGETAIFQATDAQGAPLQVTWTTSPTVGTIDQGPGATSASATYTAPAQVTSAQSVTVTASTAGGASTANITLTSAVAPISPAVPAPTPTPTPLAPSQVTITPASTVLTGGQVALFQARDNAGQLQQANWKISPTVGAADPLTGGPSTSLTYTAPAQVLSSQEVIVTATSTAGDAAATAIICLTPTPTDITPTAVALKQTQTQQFNVVVAGDPTNAVTWNISPEIGRIRDGLYTAPDALDESTTVTILATSNLCHKTAKATVTLVPPPWRGLWRDVLGVYLLAVFFLVFLLIALWPPSLPDPATARADRLEAVKDADEKAKALKEAQDALDAARTAANTATDKAAANDRVNIATAARDRARAEREEATHDLDNKKAIEDKVACSTVPVRWGPISRDADLLLLVLIAGALGSFLHSARSFADFVGNKRIGASWAWWYYLHPFMGAILALIFYLAVRAGFFVVTGGGNIKAADLSAFGVGAVATLVGMFSNQATQKLADVFDTLFKPSSGKELKDPLEQPSQASATSGTTPSATSAGATPPADQTKKP